MTTRTSPICISNELRQKLLHTLHSPHASHTPHVRFDFWHVSLTSFVKRPNWKSCEVQNSIKLKLHIFSKFLLRSWQFKPNSSLRRKWRNRNRETVTTKRKRTSRFRVAFAGELKFSRRWEIDAKAVGQSAPAKRAVHLAYELLTCAMLKILTVDSLIQHTQLSLRWSIILQEEDKGKQCAIWWATQCHGHSWIPWWGKCDAKFSSFNSCSGNTTHEQQLSFINTLTYRRRSFSSIQGSSYDQANSVGGQYSNQFNITFRCRN